MQTPHANPVWGVNWAIGGTIFAVLWHVTRGISNPWLRHLPRAVVGSLTFVPGVVDDVLLPALMAPWVYIGTSSWTMEKQLWACGPPVIGVFTWWLGSVLLTKVRKARPRADGPSANMAPEESGDARPHRPTRMLLWSLTPLLSFLIAAVTSEQLSRRISAHQLGIVWLLCLATALWHCILGLVAFHQMKRGGTEWRLVAAALFSMVGAVCWFGALVFSMMGPG